MPLPSLNITFQTVGIQAIQRSQKGIVALILKDTKDTGAHTLTGVTDIPEKLAQVNKTYIQRAFTGYQTPPKQVLLYVLKADETIETALKHFALQKLDYLVGPPDMEAAEAELIASWVRTQRDNDHHLVKAVLPNVVADHEGIINFTTSGIQVGSDEVATPAFCSRIAGLIAGTPMTISCTYAPLSEVTDVDRKTKTELDAAIDKGEFVIFHDGEKIKVGRGVNSFVTTIQGKGDAFRKIKLVEGMDLIKSDIRTTAQDHYIGKYANSYDNKCLLIMAIKGYLEELELGGILESGTSVVEIDVVAQEVYLKKQGTDTSEMTAQQIKEANTGSQVFIKANISLLDAIEDIDISITI